nr:hypothetical protein [Tanacetum cinerariifolium]
MENGIIMENSIITYLNLIEPGAFTRRYIRSHYPKTYWASLPEDILGALPEHILGALPEDILGALPEDILGALPKDILGALPEDILGALPEDILGALPEDILGALPKDILGALPEDILGDRTPSNDFKALFFLLLGFYYEIREFSRYSISAIEELDFHLWVEKDMQGQLDQVLVPTGAIDRKQMDI